MIKLYKDGVNVGEDEVLTQSLVSFNGYVQIGANRFANEIITWPSNFGGDIDEVKIYNRVLSDDEIEKMVKEMNEVIEKEDN